eukprot:SAG31_NODE_1880_length_7001_cov_4.269052_1_plen_971_part_00
MASDAGLPGTPMPVQNSQVVELLEPGPEPEPEPEPGPEPEPEPEPEPGPEPEAEPEMGSRRPRALPTVPPAADFLATNRKSSQRTNPSNSEHEPFRHGEIFFEGTGTVTKFLIVPDGVEEPEEVLRVMLGDWGMPMPSMTISVNSVDGDYFDPTSAKRPNKHEYWETWPEVWGAPDEPGQKAAKLKFKIRMTEMMYGVCRAAAESGGWIVSQLCKPSGSNLSGAIVDPGVTHFKSVRQGQASSLINVGFSVTKSVAAEPGEYVDTSPTTRPKTWFSSHGSRDVELDAESRKIWKALVLRLNPENAVPLTGPDAQKAPKSQLVYPVLGQLGEPDAHNTEGTDGMLLRQSCSHLVLSNSTLLNQRLKILTEDLVPHVKVIVSGKYNTWTNSLTAAARGAQIILLNNSGKAVNGMVKAVQHRRWLDQSSTKQCGIDGEAEKAKKDKAARQAKLATLSLSELCKLALHAGIDIAPALDAVRPAGGDSPKDILQQLLMEDGENMLEFPESVKASSFIIFDAATDSADRVIERLTSALATVGGDEFREMGFAQTEQQRLKYAWELCVLYRHNALGMERYSRMLDRLIVLVSFLTTLCAVLLSAGDARGADAEIRSSMHMVDGSIALATGWQKFFVVACAVVPMLYSFLLAVNHKFSYKKRWAMLSVAAERVCSEIYLYRARVGDYKQRTKNAKLAELVNEYEEAMRRGTDAVVSRFRSSNGSKSRTAAERTSGMNSREVFNQNVQLLQSELMSSEIKMTSMRKPPQNATKALLHDRLYPFVDASTIADDKVDAPDRPGKSALLEEGLSDFSLLGTVIDIDVQDDGVGLISADDYMKFRLLPAISRLNSSIPAHERWNNVSQTLILLGTMLAAIFGLIGLYLWIPLVVGFVAGVDSLVHSDQTSARLVGTNGSLTQLKGLRIWWQSLSRTQQSLLSNKAQLVQSSEEAIISEVSAWTQGVLRKNRKVEAEEDEERNL